MNVVIPFSALECIFHAIGNHKHFNLSETAFFTPEDQGFKLRWFTPGGEVDLCSHATLAAAYVLYKYLGYSGPKLSFNTRSGNLVVKKATKGLRMDFPASMPEVVLPPNNLVAGLGRVPKEVLAAFDYIAVLVRGRSSE